MEFFSAEAPLPTGPELEALKTQKARAATHQQVLLATRQETALLSPCLPGYAMATLK